MAYNLGNHLGGGGNIQDGSATLTHHTLLLPFLCGVHTTYFSSKIDVISRSDHHNLLLIAVAMTKTSKADQSKKLKKVAKRLGVSYASISRSFNTEPTNNSSCNVSLHEGVLIEGDQRWEFAPTTHRLTDHRANCASRMELAPTTLPMSARGD